MEQLISRRGALGLAACAVASPFSGSVAAAAETPVLVELFTSQGCSSCPPADAFAAELAKRKDVIIASYNVDYWDYLGWRDTLAKPEYSQRQYDYARARGDGQVYTPQMIVNGAAHAVGSNAGNVEALITKARAQAPLVSMRLDISESEVSVALGGTAAVSDATIWVMGLRPTVSVEVKRGENAGENIIYHNVVTHFVPMGMYKGSASLLSLPRKSVLSADCKTCVAILQSGENGPVVGLTRQSV